MVKNNRIKFIASFLKGYKRVLDIGSDHGYVLKEAFEKNYIKTAIASDIKTDPLNVAKKNLSKYPVTYYLSDGFKSIDDSFDAVLIAGMGSYNISDILSYIPKVNFDIYLMTHSHLYDLRLYLMNNSFSIINEYICYDKRFYHLFKVKRGIMNLSEKELYTGVNVVFDDAAKNYFILESKKILKYSKKANGIRKKELVKQYEYFAESSR